MKKTGKKRQTRSDDLSADNDDHYKKSTSESESKSERVGEAISHASSY